VGVKEIDEMGYEMTRGLSPRPAVVVDGTDEWQLAVTDLILEAGFELKGRATYVDFEMMAWPAAASTSICRACFRDDRRRNWGTRFKIRNDDYEVLFHLCPLRLRTEPLSMTKDLILKMDQVGGTFRSQFHILVDTCGFMRF